MLEGGETVISERGFTLWKKKQVTSEHTGNLLRPAAVTDIHLEYFSKSIFLFLIMHLLITLQSALIFWMNIGFIWIKNFAIIDTVESSYFYFFAILRSTIESGFGTTVLGRDFVKVHNEPRNTTS